MERGRLTEMRGVRLTAITAAALDAEAARRGVPSGTLLRDIVIEGLALPDVWPFAADPPANSEGSQ